MPTKFSTTFREQFKKFPNTTPSWRSIPIGENWSPVKLIWSKSGSPTSREDSSALPDPFLQTPGCKGRACLQFANGTGWNLTGGGRCLKILAAAAGKRGGGH